MVFIQVFALMPMLFYPGTLGMPAGEFTVPEMTHSDHGKITLRFRALGRFLEFHLTPDDTFLGPRVHITHVGRTGGIEEGTDGLRGCFYSSQQPFAAFSLCRGVQGAFLYGQDSYIIQPTEKSGHHLVFKAQNGETQLGSKTEAVLTHELGNQDRGTKQKSTGAQSLMAKITRGRKGNLTDNDRQEESGGHMSSPKERKGNKNSLNLENRTKAQTVHDKSSNGTIHPYRQRRFVAVDRFVEILLVADTTMVKFYGEDLKLHLLTLMSIAARIYKHPSLRNSVSLVVVKVLVVEEEDVGPDISDNGGLTLRNFCNWQQSFNPPNDRHSEHYDTAILLTRQDICGHESCDTLGVADIGTVCDPNKSCSVIEDDGLQAAYTLAHELAHVLSIPHDNSKNCEKFLGGLGKNYLMAPKFLQFNKSMPWSPCTATHLTEFFDSGHGDCLLDAPSITLEVPEELPGLSSVYDLDSQCQQVFGKEFSHCPSNRQEDLCAQLWCKIQGEHVCHTKNGTLHWADGTTCGDQRMCMDGVCLGEEAVSGPKVAVDGNWGSWGAWGECSRTCGGGVRFSHRECNDPEPQNGGKYCIGQRVIYESCNTQDCPNQEQSFRDQQCANYNHYNYTDREGKLLEWLPKYSGVSPRDRCKLVCQARGSSEFKVFQLKVVDGTLCGPESLSVCVQGQCLKAGCDHTLGSSKKLDKCAVCGGDGSSCRKVSGSLNKSKYGYTDIVTIPAGATNIDIKQRSHRGVIYDGNYLAIKRTDASYLLNGDFAVSSVEQDLHLKGTILKYSGTSTTLERIQSFHPLPEALTIQLLRVVEEVVPPKVKYMFYVPKMLTYPKTKSKDKISHHLIKPLLTSRWVFGDWSQCSKTCGSGWQRRTVECLNLEGGASEQCSPELKPEDIRHCGDLPCPIWRFMSWSPCSQSCGEGIRTQRVFCVDYTGKQIDEAKCDPGKRPAEVSTPCVLVEC
ncbi:A disintegrin and metallo ase with thrombospondin motifs 8 [Pelobates cultripes]|uniref:A disintegrin and metallo ase with thrombospondin motifs 8 n=2 Tax=Pelobates cultripes TaxID=61616 RepID=A0AAD1T714_PELCU|nr:A disintegrin and metallo ase with thrombospondin motifs 8 [Pelobates cultripes]